MWFVVTLLLLLVALAAAALGHGGRVISRHRAHLTGGRRGAFASVNCPLQHRLLEEPQVKWRPVVPPRAWKAALATTSSTCSRLPTGSSCCAAAASLARD